MIIIVIGGVRSNEKGRKSGRLRINLLRCCLQEGEDSLKFIHEAIFIKNCPGHQLHKFFDCLHSIYEQLQSTLVVTIRDTTISSLLRFDLMESIMPVSSTNLSA